MKPVLMILLFCLGPLVKAEPGLKEKSMEVWKAIANRSYKDLANHVHTKEADRFKQTFARLIPGDSQMHEGVFGKRLTNRQIDQMTGREYLEFFFSGLNRKPKPVKPDTMYVGVVREDDEIAYVLGLKPKTKNVLSGRTTVTLSFEKIDDKWWLIIPEQLEQTAVLVMNSLGIKDEKIAEAVPKE